MFPPLTPSSRVFTPGEAPAVRRSAAAGSGSVTVQSSVIIGQALTLTFLGLPPEELALLQNHWRDVRGRTMLFALSPEVLSGEDDPDALTPAGYSWRYTAPPEVEEDPTNGTAGLPLVLFDVSISLGMEPQLDAGIQLPAAPARMLAPLPAVTGT
jgi:hypothetical protein